MNVLARNVRLVPCVVSNLLLKNGGLVSRSAAFKSELQIKWVRPPKIAATNPQKSGDGGLDLKITPQDFANYYDKSKEIQDANEIVKKMFSLEFLPKKETRNKKRELTLALVQRHKADRGSMESQLAAMTSEILHVQEHLTIIRKDRRAKIFLKELIDKRKKFLGKLRRWDYKRFEWVLEKLNLVYKPNPDLYGNVTRKRSMRKLTKMHCNKLKTKKLRAYHRELKKQHAGFFNEKAEKLDFIRREEIACGREPTITEEEVDAARRYAQKYRCNRKRKIDE